MEQELPNILLDGIPFILEPKWLRQWDADNTIYKSDLKDEGHFYWFMFDRKTKGMITGMRQFDTSNSSMVRIILPADLFNRIDYHRQYHHGGFDRTAEHKRHNYQLLPDCVAEALVKELRTINALPGESQLREIVWQIIDRMDPVLKETKKWSKREGSKIKGKTR